ncbi:MAG TPA: LapA family protein [Deltaproteobacteria bacterium]|nr:LapA family protein [Deltaproteobacteria bacterium]
MKLLSTIIAMLVVLFVITFSLKNNIPVHLKYYDFIDLNVPSYMIFFISFGAGVIFTGFLDIVQRLGLKRKVTKLNRRIRELEKQLSTVTPAAVDNDVLAAEKDEDE